MNKRQFSLTLIVALAYAARMDAQVIQSAPRLVVNITIDQLRSDYMEAFSPLYGSYGFKRLLTEGRVYSNASYPFQPIDRASAITAIMTGTTPYYNSIVGERWLDRNTLRPVYCVDDDKTKGIGTQKGTSPKNVLTSTIADELKVFSQGKAIVYAIAPTRDAAVLSAGHAADGAIWIDDESGEWCSSTYYGKDLPGWTKEYNRLYPAAKEIANKVWTPDNYFTGSFTYFMGSSSQKTFSHKFNSDRRYREYKASALINENVTKTALHCIKSTEMGKDGITDLLNITYYAGNFDHNTVNECQLELQDTYVRLDKQIAALISGIELIVGQKNVLYVVTSTGYCDEEGNDYTRYKVPTGIFYINRTANLLNMYYGALWGQARYVDSYFGNQIYLNHQLLENKRISIADATQRAQEFLAMSAGIRSVYTGLQLLSNTNPNIYKIRNGYAQERCGDILVEVNPGWRILNEDNMENTLSRASFIQFPIIMFGSGVKAERIVDNVTTDRIAPTIAKSIRIRAPNACSSEPLF